METVARHNVLGRLFFLVGTSSFCNFKWFNHSSSVPLLVSVMSPVNKKREIKKPNVFTGVHRALKSPLPFVPLLVLLMFPVNKKREMKNKNVL